MLNNIDAGRLFPTTQTPALPNVRGRAGNIAQGQQNQEFYHSESPFINQGHWFNAEEGRGWPDIVFYRMLFNLSSANPIYKDNHNDVTPYNFNINLLVKV